MRKTAKRVFLVREVLRVKVCVTRREKKWDFNYLKGEDEAATLPHY